MLKSYFHPSRGVPRSRYLQRTVISITLLSIGFSVILSILIGLVFPVPDLPQGLIMAIIIPLLITPPLAYGMFSLLFQLDGFKKQIKELNRTDDLTNLLNRRHFFELAKKQLALSKRHQYPVSLLLIDIDHFKDINDRYGYQMGDTVLSQTAKILRTIVRGTDLLARYGGEEFVLLMPHTSGEASLILCQRMQRGLHEAQSSEGKLPPVTISIGAASSTDHSSDLEALLTAAHQALDQAKDSKQDTCVLA